MAGTNAVENETNRVTEHETIVDENGNVNNVTDNRETEHDGSALGNAGADVIDGVGEAGKDIINGVENAGDELTGNENRVNNNKNNAG